MAVKQKRRRKKRREADKNTQSAWKVNSYVLETSGVLIFFSHSPMLLSSLSFNFHLRSAAFFLRTSQYYRVEGKDDLWVHEGDGKKFPVSVSLSHFLPRLFLCHHHSVPLRNLRIPKGMIIAERPWNINELDLRSLKHIRQQGKRRASELPKNIKTHR